MKNTSKIWTGIILTTVMLVLIIDAKTSLLGAQDGLTLCLHTVIPSLFPFILISGMLNSFVAGQNLPFLRPIGRLCRIPEGAESILALGLLGGYPVGARCIQQSWATGRLAQHDAERMLAFCNNAGPAFIFGMVAGMFQDTYVAWSLWGIHILSAILVGALTPNGSQRKCAPSNSVAVTLPSALKNAVETTALVSGWVILFRVLIAYFNRWFFWLLPDLLQILCAGVLELSNGCYELDRIACTGLRFIIASGILAFGGICVTMQVSSVTTGLHLRAYFPGKVMHFIISILFSGAAQLILFPPSEQYAITVSFWCSNLAALICMIFFLYRKNLVAIHRKIVYNSPKPR